MMRKIIRLTFSIALLLILASCASPHFKNEMRNPHYKADQITVNGEKRSYYQLKVGSEASDTVIFYYTGSGCHDTSYMLYPLYKDLTLSADIISLPKKGIIKNSLGDTCNKGFTSNDNTNTHVSDSIKLINHILKKRPYERVVLLGHSEGAGLAWRVAEKHDKATHVYIMHRGLGMNNLDELKAKSNLATSAMKAIYAKLISDIEGTSKHFNDDDFISIKNKKSWKGFLDDKRVPAKVLLQAGKKVFILMGEKDTHVPVSSMYLSKKIFCQNNNLNLTAVLKKGHGHRIEVTNATRAAELDILAKWVNGEELKVGSPFEILTCQNKLILNPHQKY